MMDLVEFIDVVFFVHIFLLLLFLAKFKNYKGHALLFDILLFHIPTRDKIKVTNCTNRVSIDVSTENH